MLLAFISAFIEWKDLWEGSNLLISVAVEILLGVVDGHAAVDAVGQSSVLHNRDTLVRAVLVFEEHPSWW